LVTHSKWNLKRSSTRNIKRHAWRGLIIKVVVEIIKRRAWRGYVEKGVVRNPIVARRAGYSKTGSFVFCFVVV
jgi:hypothetical protein